MCKKNSNHIMDIILMAINESYDGIHILDKNGYTLYINKACERIEGITKDTIGSKTVKECVEEGIFDESITLRVLETNKEVTKIQKVINGNDVLVTGTPIRDSSNNIEYVIVNTRDITELTALEKKLENEKMLAASYYKEINKILKQNKYTSSLVANSQIMKRTIQSALNIAQTNSNVLITGESGTGKSLFAKIIHENSVRSEKPFIKIDCGAIPESLFESELFGYEKGAFTGANRTGKIGLIKLADTGTLFLDEIGEVPFSMQAKLLRFIQEKQYYKVGGNAAEKVDVRIISATNRNLEQLVAKGQFREDLYYRINVVPIKMPSLKERKEDVYLLIKKEIERVNRDNNYNKTLSSEAFNLLINYHWPGNIRELQNLIERVLVTSSKDYIDTEEIRNSLIIEDNLEASIPSTYKSIMQDYEKKLFEKFIYEGYSPIQISDILDIDVTSVRRKLHKHKINFKL